MTPIRAVDPSGCGCIECMNGEYVNLWNASPRHIAGILLGTVVNNTGRPVELHVTVIDDRCCGGLDNPQHVTASIMDDEVGMERKFDVRPWWNDLRKKLSEG